MKRPIYGKVTLKNGLTLKWLRFAESEAEAIRIVTAQHKGTVLLCQTEKSC